MPVVYVLALFVALLAGNFECEGLTPTDASKIRDSMKDLNTQQETRDEKTYALLEELDEAMHRSSELTGILENFYLALEKHLGYAIHKPPTTTTQTTQPPAPVNENAEEEMDWQEGPEGETMLLQLPARSREEAQQLFREAYHYAQQHGVSDNIPDRVRKIGEKYYIQYVKKQREEFPINYVESRVNGNSPSRLLEMKSRKGSPKANRRVEIDADNKKDAIRIFKKARMAFRKDKTLKERPRRLGKENGKYYIEYARANRRSGITPSLEVFEKSATKQKTNKGKQTKESKVGKDKIEITIKKSQNPPGKASSKKSEVFQLPPSAKATQSSTPSKRGSAKRAIDGNKNGNNYAHPCTYTSPDDNEPWWQVDFGKRMTVHKVLLYNRGDCCSQRMKDLTITVDGKLCNTLDKPAKSGYSASPAAVIKCKEPLTGRKLKIKKAGRMLTLCEVEWF